MCGRRAKTARREGGGEDERKENLVSVPQRQVPLKTDENDLESGNNSVLICASPVPWSWGGHESLPPSVQVHASPAWWDVRFKSPGGMHKVCRALTAVGEKRL